MLDLLLHHAQRLGHMAREPLDGYWFAKRVSYLFILPLQNL